jgi:hypothetical protein
MLDAVNGNATLSDGKTVYPHMYGEDGWYAYSFTPYNEGALDIYYWSMDEADRKYVPPSDWLKFLDGVKPDFPIEAMANEFESIRLKLEGVENDRSSPDTRLSDNTLQFNTANTTCLTQLMTGGLTPRYGEALHARVRYFDPVDRRAGIPKDVAALVEEMTDVSTTLSLVNIDPVEGKRVIVQTGAYGEHRAITVEMDGEVFSVDNSFFMVQLNPGCGTRLLIRHDRYANKPTLMHPWDRT